MTYSFCITCKNRLHHFKETYFKNLDILNKWKLNYEIVLLDYSSTDGLDTWVFDNCKINDNFSYFYSKNKIYYKEAHSKNVCHKLSRNEIVVNLDVDNIINDYFLENLINLRENEILMTKLRTNGSCGRITLHRNNFIALGGYDENRSNLVTRCYIDSDLKLRSLKYGLKCRLLDHNKLEFIDHSNYERSVNYEAQLTSYEDSDIKDVCGAKKTYQDIKDKKYIANLGKLWGNDFIIKNFVECLTIY